MGKGSLYDITCYKIPFPTRFASSAEAIVYARHEHRARPPVKRPSKGGASEREVPLSSPILAERRGKCRLDDFIAVGTISLVLASHNVGDRLRDSSNSQIDVPTGRRNNYATNQRHIFRC